MKFKEIKNRFKQYSWVRNSGHGTVLVLSFKGNPSHNVVELESVQFDISREVIPVMTCGPYINYIRGRSTIKGFFEISTSFVDVISNCPHNLEIHHCDQNLIPTIMYNVNIISVEFGSPFILCEFVAKSITSSVV